ncbi:Aste57867_1327 [Aphanomyces stellatus]|uniref:Aste57867_1327 protein n=1 Tax=Aphanomyces stellatus TaxID=120398 RepID=A0A485K519_9STRA|nr:hypothetical protein As57867_001326 [Aphanomyces stellatus]VFT78546.1 Aste57867_1327 [Aphanomyces stellatus]
MKLLETKDVLLRGIYDATEVNVPTSCIILPSILANQKTLQSAQEDVEIISKDFFSNMKDIGADIMKAAQSKDPVEAFRTIFGKIGQRHPLYSNLLDEVTGLPVQGVHAIHGHQHPPHPKWVSIAKIAKSVAGIFSAVGVPYVSTSTMAMVESLLELPPNSVQNYKAVESAFNGEAVTSVRGPALRELENFFKDKEISGAFAGLSRKYTQDGQAVWTHEEVA